MQLKSKGWIWVLSVALAATATFTLAAPPSGIRPNAVSANFKIDPSILAQINRINTDELHRLEIVSSLRFCPTRDLSMCFSPAPTADAEIDIHRSLFVHDAATLSAGDFSLQRTLQQMTTQVVALVPAATARNIFKQLWDTQNPAPGETGLANPHCDDNAGTVNGFPYSCRTEGAEAQGTDAQVDAKIASYAPVALVNRMDLAHQGWRNCGEYRIIYGKQGGPGRNFIIFEAVLPNPKPGCREGCLPVAEFWKSLSTMNSSMDRASALEEFLYTGLPGFRPVVHVDHYSAQGVGSTYGSSGSGQIRTNQFMQGPWMLKEFKTVLDCGVAPCKFQLVPIMVKVNPQGELWNEDVAHTAGPMQARAADFQSAVIAQIPSLANNSLTGLGYSVALEHDAAQSISQNNLPDDFRTQFTSASGMVNAFRTNFSLDSEMHLDAVGTLLTADKIIRRAVTQDCGGCHMPSTFGLTVAGSIGSVVTPTGAITTTWPNSLGFVHVSENSSALPELIGPAFPGNQGFPVSPALQDHFLVARKQFLIAELNRTRCACRSCFRFPVKAQLNRANIIQKNLDKQLIPRIAALNEKLRAERNPENASKLSADAGMLMLDRDKQLAQQLKRIGIEDVQVSLQPQAMKLRAGRLAKGDPGKEAILRQQEVLALLKKEPPRKTVTGSFRVH